MAFELRRCAWAGEDPLMVAYHDEEWGVPCHDDRELFEILMLEGFQAGLSWATILRKRENFRRAFHGWDPEHIAAYDDEEVARLLADPGIVRNRLKVSDEPLGDSRPYGRVRCPVEGPAAARVHLRRIDNLLRVHGERRDGERPRGGMLPRRGRPIGHADRTREVAGPPRGKSMPAARAMFDVWQLAPVWLGPVRAELPSRLRRIPEGGLVLGD